MAELNWYELGLRLTQSEMLFALDGDGAVRVTDVERYTFLLRLAASVSALPDEPIGQVLLDHSLRITSGCCDKWRLAHTENVSADSCTVAEIRAELNLLRTLFLDSGNGLSVEEGAWLRLGLEIADGIDLTWSDGSPAMQPAADSPFDTVCPDRLHLCYDRVVFENPQPRSWVWRRKAYLDELLGELGLQLVDLFPDVEMDSLPENQLSEVSSRRLWGWRVLAVGLSRMRQQTTVTDVRPRWDDDERVLYFGGTRVRQFQNAARNQALILRAFQENEWPRRIDNPFGDARKQNETLVSLNGGIDPALIRFRGDGTTGIRWEVCSADDASRLVAAS